MENSGFVAGTLVHTDKGLMPIQEIKIGDLVLSMPKNNFSAEKVVKNLLYKPVTQIFKSPNKLPVIMPIEESDAVCTDSQLFWAYDEWIEARVFDKGTDLIYSMSANGLPHYLTPSYYANRHHFNMDSKYLIATRDSQVAIVLDNNFSDEGISVMQPALWKFENNKYEPILTNDMDSYLGKFSGRDVLDLTHFKGIFLDKDQDSGIIAYYSELLKEVVEGNAYPFCQYVFNIEVADYHSYFIRNYESERIWVHDHSI